MVCVVWLFDRFVIVSVMICCRVFVTRWLLAIAGCVVIVGKGVWWMPWQTGPMKDVVGCDKPRGVAE